MLKLMFFTVLFIAAAAVAQEDCPNPANECPDNCGGAQCGRFLNAECRENPCHGLCTLNFFWRGRNVTDRCDVERCGDKDCPGKRQCIEETVPASCPEGRPQCRQFIRARCVLPPPPTDCSQISCGPGMFCREKRRGEGVTCVRARNCNQLTCDEGFVCSETEEGPTCIQEQITVGCTAELIAFCEQVMSRCEVVDGIPQCVFPSSCDGVECGPGLQCTVIANITGTQDLVYCLSDVASTCQGTVCAEGAACTELSLPSRSLSVGTCFDRTFASTIPVFEDFTCGGRNSQCSQQQVCVDIFEDDQFLSVFCNGGIGCTDATSCSLGQVCVEIPSDLDLGISNVCVPAGETQFEFGGSCTTITKECSPGLTCQDVSIDKAVVGTICGTSSPPSFAPSCADLSCTAPLSECYETIIEGRGSIGVCLDEGTAHVTSQLIQSILNGAS